MSSSWSNAKKARAKLLGGWFCEICGREASHGHHIIPTHKGGRDCLANCQLRCIDCERWAHENYEDGNPPKEIVERRRKYFRRVRR